jgi:hypothetical protein
MRVDHYGLRLLLQSRYNDLSEHSLNAQVSICKWCNANGPIYDSGRKKSPKKKKKRETSKIHSKLNTLRCPETIRKIYLVNIFDTSYG